MLRMEMLKSLNMVIGYFAFFTVLYVFMVDLRQKKIPLSNL